MEKRRINNSTILFFINNFILILGAFFIVHILVSELKTIDIITIILIPLFISILSYYSGKLLLREHFENFNNKIIFRLDKMEKNITCNTLILHGPKVAIPNQSKFWNSMLINSKRNFLLCSTTNKSWFNKSVEQSNLIAEHFIRLLKEDGRITIISKDEDNTINLFKNFVSSYLEPMIINSSQKNKKILLSKIRSNFSFSVHNGCNYSATLSDDTLLIIPLLNSRDFNDESIVFELNKLNNNTEFNNYQSDIDRFKINSKTIDITEWLT